MIETYYSVLGKIADTFIWIKSLSYCNNYIVMCYNNCSQAYFRFWWDFTWCRTLICASLASLLMYWYETLHLHNYEYWRISISETLLMSIYCCLMDENFFLDIYRHAFHLKHQYQFCLGVIKATLHVKN